MALSNTELQDQSRSDNPAQVYANTSFGGLLYKCVATNRPITVPKYTTLNELMSLFGDESLGQKSARDFELKYFCLGIRGSNCTGTDGDGVSNMRVNAHQPIDQSLFTMIPLIARPLSNDLDDATRAKYRLRIVATYNGIQYAVYYVKLIDFTNYNPQELVVVRDPTNNNESPDPLIHQKDDLFNPEPVIYGSDGTIQASNTYVNGSAILDCSLNANDLAEIVNAARIVKGDASKTAINEVGILWGIDTDQRGSIGDATISYKEALSLNIAHFLSERDGRNAQSNSVVTLRFDHGNSDPMLVAGAPASSTTGS